MTQGFDKDYWKSHWQRADGHGAGRGIAPNPYAARETSSLAPGTALDAGCGEGAEAIWLAAEGWQVTAVDISTEALARASERATMGGAAPERVQWVEADLGAWEPGKQFDLVTTHYAHPAMPQLVFYERISDWVAPGGTLLIVGHLHTPGAAGHGHSQEEQDGHPPEEASVTAASIMAGLDTTQWQVVTAEEQTRTLTNRAGRAVQLHDVVVRATRRRRLHGSASARAATRVTTSGRVSTPALIPHAPEGKSRVRTGPQTTGETRYPLSHYSGSLPTSSSIRIEMVGRSSIVSGWMVALFMRLSTRCGASLVRGSNVHGPRRA
jgi:SAM-dependent methyltransferase